MALRGSTTNFNTSAASSNTVNVTGIGIQQNDIILLFINGGGSGSAVFTYPSGFTAVPGLSDIDLAGADNTVSVHYKIAGASEPTSYTVSNNQNDFQGLHCRVYSGRSTVAPFSAVSSTASTAAGSFPISVSATGLTAVAGDDIVLLLAATGNSSAIGDTMSLTGPTGFGNQSAADGAVSFSPCLAFADFVNNSGGATGTLSATWSKSPGTGNPLGYCGYALSLAGGSGVSITPPVGSESLVGNVPAVINGINTVIQTFVA